MIRVTGTLWAKIVPERGFLAGFDDVMSAVAHCVGYGAILDFDLGVCVEDRAEAR